MRKFLYFILTLLVLSKDCTGTIITDNFLYLNGTNTQEVNQIDIPAYVDKCTSDILIFYTNLLIGKTYGYLTSKDKIIQDKSYEIACVEEEKIFVNTIGYLIKTNGNRVYALDQDDLISSTHSAVSNEVHPHAVSQNNVLAQTTLSSTVMLHTTTTRETSSIIISTLRASHTEINTEINTSGIFLKFIKNSFNDTNDYVYISIIILLILFLMGFLYLFRDHIKATWHNYLERREKRRVENTILKQKRIENIIRAYTNQPFNQEIIMLPSQPVVYPPSLTYQTENPPLYNFQKPPDSCDCASKCFTQKCPCINSRRACNIYCHNGQKSSKCQNYN